MSGSGRVWRLCRRPSVIVVLDHGGPVISVAGVWRRIVFVTLATAPVSVSVIDAITAILGPPPRDVAPAIGSAIPTPSAVDENNASVNPGQAARRLSVTNRTAQRVNF
jgi:hypothetical protein